MTGTYGERDRPSQIGNLTKPAANNGIVLQVASLSRPLLEGSMLHKVTDQTQELQVLVRVSATPMSTLRQQDA